MSSTSKASGSGSGSSSRNTPTKRILTELQAYSSLSPPHPTVLQLSPVSPSNLLSLHCILLPSPSLPPSSGYLGGRWLLTVTIPPNYPLVAPIVRFETKICHPNVKWETGEICLDLLGERWTPVLGVVGVLEAVGRLLGEGGWDSPLGVEVAALGREGDMVGVRSLIGFWTGEERFEGNLGEGTEGREKR